MKLTKKTEEVYNFIFAFLAEKGRMPTLMEIGEHFSFSKQRANQFVKKLFFLGYLTKIEGRYHRAYLPSSFFKKKVEDKKNNEKIK